MENSALSIPDQKNYDKTWGLAYQLACDELARIDFEQQCRNAGAEFQTVDVRKTATMPFLGRRYRIALPDRVTVEGEQAAASGEGRWIEDPGDVPLRDRLIILHYFLRAKGTPLSGAPMAFKELKEGANYFPTYAARAIKPLVDYFGKKPELLLETAKKFGGVKADVGDVSVTIPALPRVPITLVLWKGDDEFPPEASILFDSTVSDFLATEDLIVLCQVISWSLVKSIPKS